MTRILLALLAVLAFGGYTKCCAQKVDTTFYEVMKNAIGNHSSDAAIDGYNRLLSERNLGNWPFESVRQSLQDNEIVIETVCLPDESGQIEYYVFTLKKGYDSPRIYHLFKESRLDNEMAKGESLYTETTIAKLFLKPLQKELEGVRRIFFTPAGKLHQFAIEYCNAGDGQMLAEKYGFYRLTSSAVLTQRGNQRKPYTSYSIFGGIDFDKLPDFEERYQGGATKCRYGYLQDSYEAAIDIHQYLTGKGLHGKLYANESATETAMKQLSGQNVPLFFIETHGICTSCKENNAYPNALMLAGSSYALEGGIIPKGYEDGLMTTGEIAKLNLANVDLAVISACKSALGEIDDKGAGGLMRAFKIAGVKSLVMTTDDVVDYVSGEVWKVFFRNLVDGKSKREVLLDAVKHVRNIHDGFYRAPKYWTPFILIDGLD